MEIKNIVSTEKMALELSEVYISHIYGAEAAQRQKPYLAEATGDQWHVEGQLPAHLLGGTFDIRISRTDGRVISLNHSK